MRLLWAAGAATVPEIVELVRRDGHKVAYTTVLTVVSRLHRRGLLARSAEGRTHRYRPILSQDELIERSSAAAVNDVLARFGPAAMRQFAIHLAGLAPEARRQLVELAESESPAQPGSERRE